MKNRSDRIRVLYSFPHKLGASRICYTAWQQVNGLAAAGADVVVFPGAVHGAPPASVRVQPTLAWGKIRVPYKVIGSMRAFALHDHIVSRRIEKLTEEIDIIHTWPLGALRTLKCAAKLGIPTVLERPNANTRFAMEAVQQECRRLGVALPANHEHAYNNTKLLKEEEEYGLANRLLCPSDFVMKTFLDKGYARTRLARHSYGFDDKIYYPTDVSRDSSHGLAVLFAGACAVRKGLHYALEAWLRSPACKEGVFSIAGEFLPAYEKLLAPMLSDPSVRVLGHRHDIPELMRNSDILILPSIEEGSALVTSEARGSGCVLLVSAAAGAACTHLETGLIHGVGDVATLTEHITVLHNDRQLLTRLRRESLATAHNITWTAAGASLLRVYRDTLNEMRRDAGSTSSATVAIRS